MEIDFGGQLIESRQEMAFWSPLLLPDARRLSFLSHGGRQTERAAIKIRHNILLLHFCIIVVVVVVVVVVVEECC